MTIGGYHQEELLYEKGSLWHEKARSFKNGRSAFGFILSTIRPKRIFMPYYVCNSMKDVVNAYGIATTYYHLDDQMNPVYEIGFNDDSCLLIINYNDSCRTNIEKLAARWGHRLIIDNSQAYFYKPPTNSWSFYTARKWFGVADGAFLYIADNFAISNKLRNARRNTKTSSGFLHFRRIGKVQEGYKFFKVNESLMDVDFNTMSNSSEQILRRLNYQKEVSIRRDNYTLLSYLLSGSDMKFNKLLSNQVPLFFPLILSKPAEYEPLWKAGIFIPIYWPELNTCLNELNANERTWVTHQLALPIDKRITMAEFDYLVKKIKSIAGE